MPLCSVYTRALTGENFVLFFFLRLLEQHEASEEEEEGNDVEEEEEEEEVDKKASGSFSRQNSTAFSRSTEFPGAAAAQGATVSGGEMGASCVREWAAAAVEVVAAGDAGQKVKVELPVWQARVWEQDMCVCACV